MRPSVMPAAMPAHIVKHDTQCCLQQDLLIAVLCGDMHQPCQAAIPRAKPQVAVHALLKANDSHKQQLQAANGSAGSVVRQTVLLSVQIPL